MSKKVRRKFGLKAVSRKTAVAAALVVLVLASLLYGIFLRNTNPASKYTGTTADGGKVNLSPPTVTDKKQTDANKDAIVKRDETIKDSASAGQNKTASLVITDANA